MAQVPAMFEVGSKVIYPFHGVAEIVGREAQTIDGNTATYLRLVVAERDTGGPQGLVVSVPEDQAETVGLRWPATSEDADGVLEVLAQVDFHVPAAWSRRFKNHQEKLKSGDIYDCAHVVRNLAARVKVKPLAPAETSMYAHARHTLISELALSWEIDQSEAELRIDNALDH